METSSSSNPIAIVIQCLPETESIGQRSIPRTGDSSWPKHVLRLLRTIVILMIVTVSLQATQFPVNDDPARSSRPDCVNASPNSHTILYPDLCQTGPLTANANNQTIYFTLPVDGCVQLTVVNCDCKTPPCTCSVVLHHSNGDEVRWDGPCDQLDQIVDLTCFHWSAGDSDLSVDICPGGSVTIECCPCP